MRNRLYNDFDLATAEPLQRRESDPRTIFQVHRDRIVHTSAFRRLQSKTQVFFSGEYDFYRTRLTHSIEVSQVGRGICHRLHHESALLGEESWIDADLVEAACLAHDLGHPPFGHTGERTLNELMTPYGGFEGNAQTLRLLTEIIFNSGTRGLNPSRALLDSVLKYKTLRREVPDAKNHFLYDSQSSWLEFVVGEQPFPHELTPGEVRNGFRSVECQIMDWADDTAYSLNDVADGFEAGFITPHGLEDWAGGQPALDQERERCLNHLLDALGKRRVESMLGRKIGDFIAACGLAVDGNFLSPLTQRHALRLEIDPAVLAEARLYKAIARDLVFRSPQLQQLDFKARHLLTRLFEVLHDTYIEPEGSGHFRLLPSYLEQRIERAGSARQRARIVCDSLANMTDGSAIRTYKRLFDPDFGSIVDLV